MYPKPLAEKTIKRRLEDVGIGDEKSVFLHQFFLASVNLYGAATVRELWEVFEEYREKVKSPAIRRKDFVNFAGIVRREDVPYYVYEINEIYSDEAPKELDRYVVNRKLVSEGAYRFQMLYQMADRQGYVEDKPFYVPDDLLAYATDPETKEEKELLDYLGNLTVTATEYTDRRVKTAEFPEGRTYPCTHTGEKLKDFDFLTREETFFYDYISGKSGHIKGNARKAEAYLQDHRGPEAAKLVRRYKEWIRAGWLEATQSVGFLLDELNEVGVRLTKDQLQTLLDRLSAFQNHEHLWCNRGWTPMELTRKIRDESVKKGGSAGAAPVIQLGPNIRKSIAEGKIDLEELKRKAAEMGIQILDI